MLNSSKVGSKAKSITFFKQTVTAFRCEGVIHKVFKDCWHSMVRFNYRQDKRERWMLQRVSRYKECEIERETDRLRNKERDWERLNECVSEWQVDFVSIKIMYTRITVYHAWISKTWYPFVWNASSFTDRALGKSTPGYSSYCFINQPVYFKMIQYHWGCI